MVWIALKDIFWASIVSVATAYFTGYIDARTTFLIEEALAVLAVSVVGAYTGIESDPEISEHETLLFAGFVVIIALFSFWSFGFKGGIYAVVMFAVFLVLGFVLSLLFADNLKKAIDKNRKKMEGNNDA